MKRPDGLCDLVIVVRDLQDSIRFYRDLLGLEPAAPPGDQWAWFYSGAVGTSPRFALTTATLLFEEHSSLPEGARFGPSHYAFKAHREDLPTIVQRMEQAGVTVHGPQRLDWMLAEAHYMHDPDDNLVELWTPD